MIDETTDAVIRPEPTPAFAPAQAWNAGGCAAVCVVGFLAFAIFQGVVSVWLFFHAYPEVLRFGMTPADAAQLKTPAGLARIFTPRGLVEVTTVGYMGLFLAGPLFARYLFPATWANLGIGIRPGVKSVLLGVGAGAGLLLVATLIGGIEAKLFGPHPQPIAQVLTYHHGPRAFLVDLFSVALIAPICEELFFRGVLFAGLVQRLPLWPAAIISGFIFGALHGDLWNLPSLAAIGVGLAIIYYYTRTLWANIAAHSTVNAISLLLAFVAPQLAR